MKMPRPSGPVRRAVKILVAALMLAAVTAYLPIFSSSSFVSGLSPEMKAFLSNPGE